jgi:hypothetical protein
MTLLVNPTNRWGASMAELPTSNKLVLFGGKTTADYLSDSYSWDGNSWSLLNIAGPSRRCDAAMSYDGSKITLVGGTDGEDQLSDAWSYNGTVWAKQAITNAVSPPSNYTAPTMLKGASMAYQSSPNEAVLFGGIASFQRHYVLDTWVWTSGAPGTWMQLAPANNPTGRVYAAMASNATTAILFGGKNFDGPLSDTLKWDGSNWAKTATNQTPGVSSPSARYGASMAYNASTSQFVLFGGITKEGFSNETWTFSTGTNTWTKGTSGPLGRAYASMAYLTANTTVVLFGGLGSDRTFNDTWVNTAGLWAQK